MSSVLKAKEAANFRREAMRIAGEKVHRDRVIEITNPYSGELVGTVPKATLEALPADAQHRLKATARDRLARAGAHYVIDGIADLGPVIEAITARLARGEAP